MAFNFVHLWWCCRKKTAKTHVQLNITTAYNPSPTYGVGIAWVSTRLLTIYNFSSSTSCTHFRVNFFKNFFRNFRIEKKRFLTPNLLLPSFHNSPFLVTPLVTQHIQSTQHITPIIAIDQHLPPFFDPPPVIPTQHTTTCPQKKTTSPSTCSSRSSTSMSRPTSLQMS